MKTASVTLKLTKDHHIAKFNITPIEAMLLASEHNINSGGDPIEVDKASIKEVKQVKVANEKGAMVDTDWTDDLELRRLRGIYGAKVDRLNNVRNLPTDYDGPTGAVIAGKALTSPQSGPAVIAKVEIK